MLYLSDILDLNCLLGTFEAATFTNLNLNMTVAQLGLEPVGEGGLEERNRLPDAAEAGDVHQVQLLP